MIQRSRQFQKPMLFTADGNHDPSWFPGFENDEDLMRFCPSKEAIHKVIAPAIRSLQQRRGPFLTTILDPIAKLLCASPEKTDT
jgi:hypothetical protein